MIGRAVWIFDHNRRVYGPTGGAPIYREHFRTCMVVGESRTCWILEGGRRFNKKTGMLNKERDGYFGTNPHVFTSIEEVDNDCWLVENRQKIAEMVSRCKNVNALRTIRGILGGSD